MNFIISALVNHHLAKWHKICVLCKCVFWVILDNLALLSKKQCFSGGKKIFKKLIFSIDKTWLILYIIGEIGGDA